MPAKTLVRPNVVGLNAYRELLKHRPRIGSRKRRGRANPRRQPSTGPLADASRRQAVIAVRDLRGCAEQTGYPRRTSGAPCAACGRPNEIAGASMGSICTGGTSRWRLDIVGNDNRPRRLPAPPDMLDSFRACRQAFELLPRTGRTGGAPRVLSPRSRDLARIMDEAASAALGPGRLTRQANTGVQLTTPQDKAGHANIATSSASLHGTDNERYDEIIASVNGRRIRQGWWRRLQQAPRRGRLCRGGKSGRGLALT